MKNIKIFLALFSLACIVLACGEEEKGGTVKPSAITDYEVTPINGGAIITYAIPKDPNIMCVTAEYTRNGEPYLERSSAYNNSLRVEGFKTTDPVTVTLYTQNRSEDHSDPLTITFTPLKSLVDLAKESLEFTTSFGGLNMSWENISNTELNIHLMAFVDGEMTKDDIYFSTLSEDKRSYRGYDAVETDFAITIGDKWGNISDTAHYYTTPLFEMEVPKPWGDMRTYAIGDNTTEFLATHVFTNIFDGKIGTTGWLCIAGSAGCSFTLDFKEVFKLSRYKFWPSLRSGIVGDVYGNVNITEFEIWGSAVFDTDKPASYWADNEDPTGTFKEDWEYLGYFIRERLDLQGATNDEIWQRGAVDGDEWELPLELGPVRYIRFYCRATADGKPVPNNYWQLGELSFFGSNRIN
ncbi:MAG: DUF4959 domain-containing protein [Dysgonamonadaceae bacterium]|jgi:hypothetical protein|nr:DUF4959 domain-containing protein [Dysgonamonadaceae bacterium]